MGVLFLLLNGLGAANTYTDTPFGPMLSHCVHSMETLLKTHANGTPKITRQPGAGLRIEHGGVAIDVPKCKRNGLPLFQNTKKPSSSGPLPPDYDGWLQYTALNTSRVGVQGGFDSFTNTMSVPDEPKAQPQILYFFPGLQNIDWIPKVDPEPQASFDIIQPVLQFPGGSFGGGWALKSWYVTLDEGAIESRPIKVEEGDEILCNMTRTGQESFFVSGALKSDPSKSTSINVDKARLSTQPWAYNTLECYGCRGCETYPQKPITFTENKLYQGGKLLDTPGALWGVNVKPAQDLKCNEATKVAENGDTTISFQ